MIQGLLDDAVAAELETPAVVVDLDRAEARIARMAAVMRERGVALRPHTKTHKSLEFARRQVDGGRGGLDGRHDRRGGGLRRRRLRRHLHRLPGHRQGPRADRLRALVDRCTLSVGADSAVGLELLARAVRGADRSLSVVIEIDCGGARTGVAPELAGTLARQAEALGLRVAGAFTHGGQGYAGTDARAPAADAEVAGLEAAAAALRAEGIEPTVLSAGSTPTAELSAHGIVTEERPGMYVFGDRQEAALQGKPFEETALMVAATVVSGGPGNGFVIDAGAKVLGKDTAPYLAATDPCSAIPGAVIERVYDHHGVVELPAGSPRPAIGSVVWVMPNHVCPVVNLVDEYVVARDGRVVDRWRVDARGRNS